MRISLTREKHTVHTIRRKQTDTEKTVVYQSACLLAYEYFCLFFSHLYSIFARETKQAFWIHLTAQVCDKIDFVSLLMGEKLDENVKKYNLVGDLLHLRLLLTMKHASFQMMVFG